MPDSPKEKFWSVTAESVFGIRWVKTPRAKVVAGILMIAFGTIVFFESVLASVLFLVGGGWYIYRGIKDRKE